MNQQPLLKFIEKTFQKLIKLTLPDPPAQLKDGISFWRQRIFLAVVLSSLVFGLGAYLTGGIQFFREENWTMVILDTGFYLFAILTAFSPKIKLNIRFYAVLSLFFVIGVALLLSNGTGGSGLIWLFSFTILAGIFFNVKGAIIAIAINTLSLTNIKLIAISRPSNFLPISEMHSGAYLTVAFNFLLLSAMVSISLSVLSNGLSKTLSREKEISRSLEKEISEHKITENQLVVSKERLTLALEAVNDGLWDWDLTTDEVYYSPQWETMLGYEPGEIEGHVNSWKNLIHPEDALETTLKLQRHLDGETPNYESEHRLRTKSGDWLWIMDRGTIVSRSASGKPVRMTGTHTNISDRKRIENELEIERSTLAKRVKEQTSEIQAANNELVQASKMKDNFLAAMSHELRTPLNAILGFSEALMEGIYGPLNREQNSSISRIQDAGNHLLYLINDILDISKLQAEETTLDYASLSITKTVEECFSFIDQMANSKQISTIRNIDPLVKTFVADERRFKQIMINLLSNAVKFTPDGGSIGLDVSGHPTNNLISFSVWDNGIGIATVDIPKLFEPFMQLDSSLSRKYTGTGLGLALARHLTELHRGQIEVKSEPGKGSCFIVTLPWSINDNEPNITTERKTESNLMHTFQTALIIEDSDIMADMLTRYLKEMGIAAETCSQETEWSPVYIANKQPDVIILDILLPDISGWEILKQLKEHPLTVNIPVIIATVVNEREKGKGLGASEYLQKPISRSSLAQALRNLASNKTRQETNEQSDKFQENATILLAEDNHSNAETILDYLNLNGFTTIWVRNGREAINKTQQTHPNLILMDMQMPEMDGLEAIQRIRRNHTFDTIPIIALTALAMQGDKERFLNAGANAYLSKPVGLKNLLQVINDLLEK